MAIWMGSTCRVQHACLERRGSIAIGASRRQVRRHILPQQLLIGWLCCRGAGGIGVVHIATDYSMQTYLRDAAVAGEQAGGAHQAHARQRRRDAPVVQPVDTAFCESSHQFCSEKGSATRH